jgi:hypothetical protein
MTTDPHAVRWALGKMHWTKDGKWTLCGRLVRTGAVADTDPARVDCRLCRSRKSFKEATQP